MNNEFYCTLIVYKSNFLKPNSLFSLSLITDYCFRGLPKFLQGNNPEH